MKKLMMCLMTSLFAIACTDDFRPPSLVDGLKVIAVRAEPPYIAATGGSGTRLEAKVVGVDPQAPLCHAWALCLFAANADGRFGCVDQRLQVDLGTDASATATVLDVLRLLDGYHAFMADQPQAGLADAPTPTGPPGSSGAPEVTVLFGVAEAAAFGGTCPASASAFLRTGCLDRDRCTIGQRSLKVAMNAADRHENPTLTSLRVVATELADGATASVAGASSVALVPTWTTSPSPGAPADSASSGEILLSWHATAGTFERQRSYDAVPGTSWQAAGVPAGQPVDVWVVARDGRGGVAWLGVRLDR
jgi:hypothetical protein